MFAARNMMFAGVSAAGAYIAAVETALGSSITSTQKDALNAFVLAEQAAGRWTSHKRLYLPIWANAAANAICLKSLASGTFAGTVTHASGYVQGDGSTGYFNFGSTPSAQGLTTSAAGYSVLIYQAGVLTGSRSYLTCSDNGSNTILAGLGHAAGGAVIKATFGDSTNSAAAVESSLTHVNANGIILGSRLSGSSFLQRRRTAGNSTLQTDADAGGGTIPTNQNMIAMAFNYNGTPSGYSDARLGSFSTFAGFSSANADAFTLNLKTLWETCTGLTLP